MKPSLVEICVLIPSLAMIVIPSLRQICHCRLMSSMPKTHIDQLDNPRKQVELNALIG